MLRNDQYSTSHQKISSIVLVIQKVPLRTEFGGIVEGGVTAMHEPTGRLLFFFFILLSDQNKLDSSEDSVLESWVRQSVFKEFSHLVALLVKNLSLKRSFFKFYIIVVIVVLQHFSMHFFFGTPSVSKSDRFLKKIFFCFFPGQPWLFSSMLFVKNTLTSW